MAGWGDDDEKKKKTGNGKKKDEKPEPLTDNEIEGLRAILERHGYDSEKGTF